MSQRKPAILNRLDAINWHDLPITSLTLHTDERLELALDLLVYEETRQKYRPVHLRFRTIETLEMGKLHLTHQSDLELFGFDYSFQEPFFHGKLHILLGNEQPDLTLTLACRNIILKA